MQIVPMASNGARTVTVNLGDPAGVLQFRTYWNYTASMWFMDILREDGTVLAQGLALVPDRNILAPYPALDFIGEIRVADIDGTGNATTESLGVDAQVVQFNPGEYEETFPEDDAIPPLSYNLDDVLAQ